MADVSISVDEKKKNHLYKFNINMVLESKVRKA